MFEINPANPDTLFFHISPSKSGLIDMAVLFKSAEVIPQSFIQLLFNDEPFSIEVDPGPYLEQKFYEAHFRQSTLKKKKGGRSLGIAYPIFYLNWDKKQWSFPLFIWSIDLNYTPGKIVIARPHSPRVTPNFQFLKFFKTNFQLDFYDLFTQFSGQTKPTFSSLNKVLESINESLSTSFVLDQETPIRPFPEDLEQLLKLSSDSLMMPSAILGNFPPLFHTNTTHQTLDPSISSSYELEDTVNLIKLDPSQKTAFSAILQNDKAVVYGTRGTGKTHLALQLICNALSNQKSTLVVSEYLASLKEIQQKVFELGIHGSSFLLQFPEQDTLLLWEFLKSSPPPINNNTKVKLTKHFKQQLNKLIREKDKLEQRYQAVKKPVIGGYNWTQLVGIFLQHHRQEDKNKLSPYLNAQDFRFDEKEFGTIFNSIDKTYPLFIKVKDINCSLNELSIAFFTENTLHESNVALEKKLRFYISKAQLLIEQLAKKQAEYAEKLFLLYDGSSFKLIEQLDQLKDIYYDSKEAFGAALNQSQRILLFKSIFSSKTKRLRATKKKVINHYNQLKNLNQRNSLFNYQFPSSESLENFDLLEQFILNFESTLTLWRKDLNSTIQDAKSRLSIKTVDPKLGLTDSIKELEFDIERFVYQLNEERLLAQKIDNQTILLRQQQTFIENLLQQLISIQGNLPDFSHFFNWKRHWLLLTEREQKVVTALIKVNPDNWESAFKSWYYNNLLIKLNNPSLPSNGLNLSKVHGFSNALIPLQKEVINLQILERRSLVLNQLKKNKKQLYQSFIGDKFSNIQLFKDRRDEVLQLNAAVIEAIPLFLTTPSNLTEVLSMEQSPSFDYVIVDDSHNLPVASLEAIASWGKQIIYLTDPELVRENEAFHSFFDESTSYELSHIHQWQPANLFSFRGGRTLQHSFSQTFDIQFHQIEGRYDENRHINTEEADYILTLLNEIKETPQRTFPRVGIACLTEAQCFLIQNYLERIKQQDLAGSEKIKQLERNGLSVCTLSDLSGDQFETLIVCVTLGQIDLKGTITKDVFWLKQKEATIGLKKLINAGGKSIYVINSLPIDVLEQFFEEEEGNGLFILSMYLLYLKAIKDSNSGQQEEVINRFQEIYGTIVQNYRRNPDLFLQEVVRELRETLPNSLKIETYDQANINFPYVIKDPGNPSEYYYLLADGFLNSFSTIDFSWEYDQLNYLKRNGLKPLPIWSVNWWKNKEEEKKRIRSILEPSPVKNKI